MGVRRSTSHIRASSSGSFLVPPTGDGALGAFDPFQSTAPLRISFVGGGTDFPHWYEEHGGAVLSATIDHSVRVRLIPRPDRQISVRSHDLGHLVEYHLDEGPDYDGVMDLPKAA